MVLLVHDLDGLAHHFNLLAERRDALQQLRRECTQLFGIRVVEVGGSKSCRRSCQISVKRDDRLIGQLRCRMGHGSA